MFSLITSLIIAFADDLTLPICFAFSVQLAARFLPPPVILQLFSCTKPTAVIWGSSHTIINASPHIFFSFPASDNVTLTALQWNPPKCSCSVLQLWTQIDIYTPTSTHDKRHETLPGGEAVNGVLKGMKTLLVLLYVCCCQAEKHMALEATHHLSACRAVLNLQTDKFILLENLFLKNLLGAGGI